MNEKPSQPVADRKWLATPLQYFPGIGPQRAVMLEKLGIRKPLDLLFYFPRAYQDIAPVRDLGELEPEVRTSVEGVVEAIELRTSSEGRTSLGVLLVSGRSYLRLVWYNQSYRAKLFARGMRVVATGIPRSTGISWEMRHPDVQIVAKDSALPAGRPQPIYGLTEGLQQRHLQAIVHEALEHLVCHVIDVLPAAFRDSHRLLEIQVALRQIHEPSDMEQAQQARYRFIFQELLVYQLALAMRRYQLQHSLPAPSLPTSGLIDARILRRFPFTLTGDQRQAIDEVCLDMAKTVSMNRLIQGDVGSGKTVVALYAMLLAVAHRYQSALMAPTEVLARQHASRLSQSLKESHVEVGLLVGSLTTRERSELQERITLGTVDIVVGTQALLSENVQFANLGLVVIDEQHKFGVEQRASLRGTLTQPHYLVLSATPIPRTLTMTAMGDLDLSILRDKPEGRAKVHTYLGESSQKDSWWEFVAKQVNQGRQAYVIAARVEQSDDEELQGAEQIFRDLQSGPLATFRLGLLHGRMDGERKQTTLDAFSRGEIQVLVATTVVEVGIDVPNATVMTILDSDRLGLAQLHQLRGRISRGTHTGYLCLFASPGANLEESARLQALASTDDGFQLAEMDLQLRGPGNLLGTQQHGLPSFRIADLVRDTEVIALTREVAQQIIEADPTLTSHEWLGIQKQVLSRHGETLALGDVG